jgi:hypothetical protein
VSRLRWRLRLGRLRWRWRRLQWQYALAVEGGNADWANDLWPRVAHARRAVEIEQLYKP